MAMVSYLEVKSGMVIREGGDLCVVLEVLHLTPGNLRAIMQFKLRNLKTGRLVQARCRPQDKVEQIFVEKKELEYLYKDATGLVFQDTETYEQTTLPVELLGEGIEYLKSNTLCSVELNEGKIINISLPDVVDMEVIDTDPVVKGQTATNQYKSATLETGVHVTVPPFITKGEKIRVDTRTGKYLERAK